MDTGNGGVALPRVSATKRKFPNQQATACGRSVSFPFFQRQSRFSRSFRTQQAQGKIRQSFSLVLAVLGWTVAYADVIVNIGILVVLVTRPRQVTVNEDRLIRSFFLAVKVLVSQHREDDSKEYQYPISASEGQSMSSNPP